MVNSSAVRHSQEDIGRWNPSSTSTTPSSRNVTRPFRSGRAPSTTVSAASPAFAAMPPPTAGQVHVFRLDRHVRRLEQSARILCLRLPGPRDEVAASIVELLRRNEMRCDVYIRPIVFANSNALSPLLDPDTSATAIFCMPIGRYLSADAHRCVRLELAAHPGVGHSCACESHRRIREQRAGAPRSRR